MIITSPFSSANPVAARLKENKNTVTKDKKQHLFFPLFLFITGFSYFQVLKI
jgi:hypothetical protein